MIKLLPKSAWRYGAQIVMLFAVAALTSGWIIAHLEHQLASEQKEELIWQLNVSIWSLTMGFMFLSGALGLWAIRSTAETEGRRRLGRFVDAMDYMSDGLFVLDRKGKIIGSNPAIQNILRLQNKTHLPSNIFKAFPFLDRNDADMLLRSKRPHETHADCVYPRGLRTLRFRSQPSDGMVILIVSDVTEERSSEIRQKQIAQLQLVGRIAGGLAHDFNDILCAISGHSALLKRNKLDPVLRSNSLDIIARETSRGAVLSKTLLDLSRSGKLENPSINLAENVREAAALLRVALAPGWTVQIAADSEFPPSPLAPSQIEQVVLNLGLLAADDLPRPGTIMVTLNAPAREHLLAVGDRFAAVILISANLSDDIDARVIERYSEDPVPVIDQPGVILSVVSSMVEEAGGRMDHLDHPGKLSLYRVCLPHLDMEESAPKDSVIPPGELNVYISRWTIAKGGTSADMNRLAAGLRNLGATVEEKNDIGALLSRLEEPGDLDAVIIDKHMLGKEPETLVSTMIRLAPRTGIVVIGQELRDGPNGLDDKTVFLEEASAHKNIVHSLVDAKTLARARDHHHPLKADADTRC